jgi:YD repeat-containing protein
MPLRGLAFNVTAWPGETIGTLTLSVGYAYTNGDLTAISTPSGQAIVYTYNSNHQITGITVNGATLLSNVSYEPLVRSRVLMSTTQPG